LNNLGRRLGHDDLYFFFGLLLHLPLTWAFLESDNKTRIEQLLLQTSAATAPRILPTTYSVADLEVASRKKTSELDSEQLGRLLEVSKHPIAIAHAVNHYCGSKSWDLANTRYTHVIQPILGELSDAQIRRILVAAHAEDADLNGANSFNTFIKHVYEHERIPRDELLSTLRGHSMDWIAERLEASKPSGDSDESPDESPF
jgi:hypothetical protein